MATTNIDWVKENQTKFDTNLKGNLCLRNYWKVTGYVVLIDRGTKGQKIRCPCQAQESGTKRGKTLSPCQTREWHKGRENELTPIKAELSGQPKKSPNDNRSSKIFWRLIIKVLSYKRLKILTLGFLQRLAESLAETYKKHTKVTMNMYTWHLWLDRCT